MAEIPNRDELEANFAKKFGKLARRHMHEYRELLGDPANPDNVPQTFWDKMQREVDNESYAILLLMFLESSDYHGWGGYDAKLAGYGWATERAENLSKYWVDSTRARLADGFEKLTRPEPIKETTVDEARAANRFSGVGAGSRTNHGHTGQSDGESELDESGWLNPYEPKPIDKDDLRKLLDQTFGPKRVERTAIIETTAARSAGGEAGVEATYGLCENDIYLNPDDESTCEICFPLIGKPRSVWIVAAPDGPPPTDSVCRCRCCISYEADRVRDGLGTTLPVWTMAEWIRYSQNPEKNRR